MSEPELPMHDESGESLDPTQQLPEFPSPPDMNAAMAEILSKLNEISGQIRRHDEELVNNKTLIHEIGDLTMGLSMRMQAEQQQEGTDAKNSSETAEKETANAAAESESAVGEQLNADGKPPPVVTPKATTFSLGSWTGVSYDGTPESLPEYIRCVKSDLGSNHKNCLLDEEYHGRDAYGKLISHDSELLRDLRTDGSDLQSQVGAWLTKTLTGYLRTTVDTLQDLRENEPVDGCHSVSGFEIYSHILQQAQPKDGAYDAHSQCRKRFQSVVLPPRVGREEVLLWVAEKEKDHAFLNTGADTLSEHTLVATILDCMEKHHDPVVKVLKAHASLKIRKDGASSYSLASLKTALEDQFPKGYGKPTAAAAFLVNGAAVCPRHPHSNHTADQCVQEPSNWVNHKCKKCNEIGHHEWVCKGESEQSKQAKKKAEEKKAKDKAKRMKKEKEKKALIALGKHVAQHAQPALAPPAPTPAGIVAAALQPAQAPPPAPAPPAVTVHIPHHLIPQGKHCNLALSPEGLHADCRTSDVVLQASGMFASAKPGSNANIIDSLLNEPLKAPPVTECPTVDLTHSVRPPDDPDPFCMMTTPAMIDGLPVTDLSTPAIPSNWVKVSVMCDSGSDLTILGNYAHLSNSQPVTLSDHATSACGGKHIPDAIGTAYLVFGNAVVALHGSQRSSQIPTGILSEGHLEEMGLIPSRETSTIKWASRGIHLPLRKEGRRLIYDTWVFIGSNPESDPDIVKRSMLAKRDITYDVMHRRLCHPSQAYMEQTQPLVYGFPTSALKPTSKSLCGGCPAGKSIFRLEPTSDPDCPRQLDSWESREAIAMDTSKFMPDSFYGGNVMYVLLDLADWYVTGIHTKGKTSETSTTVFFNYSNKNTMPSVVYYDGGPENTGRLEDLLEDLDIQVYTSAPNAHDQNIAETIMRILSQKWRCAMTEAKPNPPIEAWADALLNTIDCMNVTFSKGSSRGDKGPMTPYEAHFGRKPDVTMFRPFWCLARILIPDPHNERPSYLTKVYLGHYVRTGLVYGFKAWLLYVPDLRTFMWSRDVVFDELGMSGPCPDPKVPALLPEIFPVNALTTAPPEPSLVDSRISDVAPRAPKDANLANNAAIRGKQGTHAIWMEYLKLRRAQILKEDPDADKDKTLKQRISKEWKSLSADEKLKAVSAGGEHTVGGASIRTEPVPLQPPSPAVEVGGEQLDTHEATLTHEAPKSTNADHFPEITGDKPSFVPNPLPRLRTKKALALLAARTPAFIETAAKVVETLGTANDCITQGRLSEAGWEFLTLMVKDPTTVNEALNGKDSEHWRKAIQDELQSLIDKEVYKVISRKDVPKGKKILRAKVVWKYKPHEGRYKARVVLLGFLEPDEDVGETFAPVAKFTTFRILMAIACQFDLEISSSDVKTAFLNADIEGKVYSEPPKGLGFDPNDIWEISKYLYGLKGAPRGWNKKFHKWLIALGFTQSPTDPCLYSIAGLWILIWVDDALKIGTKEKIAWFEKAFNKAWEGKHDAEVKVFVGIEINRNREERTLSLTQTSYITKFLKRFGMSDCNGERTPMAVGTYISKEDCPKGDTKLMADYHEKGFDVRAATASMLYAAICTRPDALFAVKELCKIMSDPGVKHVSACKRALRYFAKTKSKGLNYKAVAGDIFGTYTADITLVSSADASYADDVDTRKSTQAFIGKLLGAAVSWFSQTQKCVTLSTTEAELYALSDSIKEILYIRSTMAFLDLPQRLPTVIFEDNAAVVAIVNNPGKHHSKLKHVATRVKMVQEHVMEIQTCEVVKEDSKDLEADLGTKALPAEPHERHTDTVLGITQLSNK